MSAKEPRDVALKRLRMRSWRRGMKEMDLILGHFADSRLAEMDPLDAYDRLLGENDQDLYAWVAGSAPVPAEHQPLISQIRAFHAAT